MNAFKIGLILPIFIVGIFLFSSLGFAYDDINFTTSYDSTNNVWYFILNHKYTWVENTCLDLDAALPILNDGLQLWIDNITVDCGDTAADVKCINAGSSTTWGSPQNNYIGRMVSIDNVAASMDAVRLAWSRPQDTNRRKVGFTDGGYYYTAWVSGETVLNQYCYDAYFWMKNETYNPYLTSNKTTDDLTSYLISVNMNPYAEIDRVHFFLTDLGYSINKYLVSSAEWTYYYDNPLIYQASQLAINGGLGEHTFYNTEYNTDNTISDVACEDDITNLQSTNLLEINIPSNTYDIFCHNGSTAHNTGINYRWYVLKVINNTDNNFDAFLGAYGSTHTSIFNVFYTPGVPLPNMSVTIHWETSTPQNGTLFWRSKEIGNWSGGWSAWTMQENTNLSIGHNSIILGSNILDKYQYQFYVRSADTVDNNTDFYYNFTVGGYAGPVNTIPPGLENVTYPVLYNATEDFAENMGITQTEAVNIFAVFLLVMLTFASVVATHSIVMGGTVLTVGILVFSLMGFLPYYLFIAIALIFAFILLRFIMGVFGNG